MKCIATLLHTCAHTDQSTKSPFPSSASAWALCCSWLQSVATLPLWWGTVIGGEIESQHAFSRGRADRTLKALAVVADASRTFLALQKESFAKENIWGDQEGRPGTEGQVWYRELSFIRTCPLLACTALNEESWKSCASYLHCPATPTVESSTFPQPKLLLNCDPAQGDTLVTEGATRPLP